MSKIGSVTVNKEDVAHHSDNASNWWNPEGPVRLLYKLNPMRVQFISEAVGRPFQEEGESLKGLKILDAACGGGLLSEDLAMLGAEVVGVDASEKLIEEAKNHAALNPKLRLNVPKYIYTTVEQFPVEQSRARLPAIPKKKKKLVPKEIPEKPPDSFTSYLKKPENETDAVAKVWAIKLSRLVDDQRRFAEKIINDTLFEAAMGTLTRNGVCFIKA